MRLFQINEDDLAELERLMPQLCEFATMQPDAQPKHRRMFAVMQRIITNVRWGYGPPTDVQTVPAGDDE